MERRNTAPIGDGIIRSDDGYLITPGRQQPIDLIFGGLQSGAATRSAIDRFIATNWCASYSEAVDSYPDAEFLLEIDRMAWFSVFLGPNDRIRTREDIIKHFIDSPCPVVPEELYEQQAILSKRKPFASDGDYEYTNMPVQDAPESAVAINVFLAGTRYHEFIENHRLIVGLSKMLNTTPKRFYKAIRNVPGLTIEDRGSSEQSEQSRQSGQSGKGEQSGQGEQSKCTELFE